MRFSYRAGLMAGTGLGLLCVLPAVAAENGSNNQTEQVLIQGQTQDFKINAPNVAKLTEPLLDTPQTIDTISEALIKDRAATDFNEALRSVPGISIGAGEFRYTGNAPTVRGFVARDDMFLDGIRDFGNYYRDPFNLENIEVLEGPSSVLFGRGSTGGVINQSSKLPVLDHFISGAFTFGTDMTRRATVDINETLPDLGPGAAFRLTAMGHEAKYTDRNVADTSRYGFAPSLAFGLGTPDRLTISYYHLSTDDIPDYGIPYLGAYPAPVPRQNFYGFASDYQKTDADIGTVTFEHDFEDGITFRNEARAGEYTHDFRITEPLTPTTATAATPPGSVVVTRNVDTGNGTETILWDQASATARFATGGIDHVLVFGAEGGQETANPVFDNSTGVPSTSLLTPNSRLAFSGTTFPRFETDTTAWNFGAFMLDTLKFGTHWELTGGVRWDYFGAKYSDANYSTTAPGTITRTDRVNEIDRMPSYRAALVYKPETNGTVYFSYSTSFNPSAEDLSLISSSRSFAQPNDNLAPEKNENFEIGTKWNVFEDRLALTGSVFRLQKDNARVPDPANTQLDVLGGDQRVDGVQLQAVGYITPDWQFSGGYAYLDSEVVKSAPGAAPVGSPLMNTPKNSLTFWTEYHWGRFVFGGGGQYMGKQTTQNVPPDKYVPSYWVFDAMAKYELSERLGLQLNVRNLFDKYYFDQLHFFHVVPAEGRTALLTLNFRY